MRLTLGQIVMAIITTVIILIIIGLATGLIPKFMSNFNFLMK